MPTPCTNTEAAVSANKELYVYTHVLFIVKHVYMGISGCICGR